MTDSQPALTVPPAPIAKPASPPLTAAGFEELIRLAVNAAAALSDAAARPEALLILAGTEPDEVEANHRTVWWAADHLRAVVRLSKSLRRRRDSVGTDGYHLPAPGLGLGGCRPVESHEIAVPAGEGSAPAPAGGT